MSGLFDNPMGLVGFEFIEFAAPAINTLESLFERTGFTLVARHREKDVVLYRQGGINFVVNREPGSIADSFAAEHGPSACGFAFRVKDAQKAYALALERGALPIDVSTRSAQLRLPAVKGIGGAPLYLVDRLEDGKSIYDIDFEFLPGVDRHPRGHGFKNIDRLTSDVDRGCMVFRGSFYERIFGFREIRFFEPVDAMRWAAIPLPSAPDDVYDDKLEGRLACGCEPAEELKTRGILLDGSTRDGRNRLLLQIFSEPRLGPAFFEFIQRKNDEGSGEGNFQALFEPLERDQTSPLPPRCFADLAACDGHE